MFLTTNRVKDFDDAVQSRISVALCYPPLRRDTRRKVWENFLEKIADTKIGAEYTSKDIDRLAERQLNGRQVYW